MTDNNIVDYILIETNKRASSYEEMDFPNFEDSNGKWITSVRNGIVINSGDTLQIEACMINSKGDGNEIELVGDNIDGIFDNDIAFDLNYYLTNRQQYNFNLPSKDNYIQVNPNSPLYGSPDLESYKNFLANYPFENIEGLFWNSNPDNGLAWKQIRPFDFQPRQKDNTGLYYQQWKKVMFQNAPDSIRNSNNKRLYVGQKDWIGAYEVDDKGLSQDWSPFVINSKLKLPEGFATPESISNFITENLHSRSGNALEFQQEEVEAELFYPNQYPFNEDNDIDFNGRGKEKQIGIKKLPSVTDVAMRNFHTTTGRVVNGAMDGSWSNFLAWSNGKNADRTQEFTSTYVKDEGRKVFYQNLLVGDIARVSSFNEWYKLINDGQGRFNNLDMASIFGGAVKSVGIQNPGQGFSVGQIYHSLGNNRDRVLPPQFKMSFLITSVDVNGEIESLEIVNPGHSSFVGDEIYINAFDPPQTDLDCRLDVLELITNKNSLEIQRNEFLKCTNFSGQANTTKRSPFQDGGWFGNSNIVFDRMNLAMYSNIQRNGTNLGSTQKQFFGKRFTYNQDSQLIESGVVYEDITNPLNFVDIPVLDVKKYNLFTTNIPYTKTNVKQISKWLKSNQIVQINNELLAELNIGNTDDSNSYSMADQYTYLCNPFQFNYSMEYNRRFIMYEEDKGLDGYIIPSYNDYRYLVGNPLGYHVDDPTLMTELNGNQIKLASYRYQNFSPNKGALSTKIKIKTELSGEFKDIFNENIPYKNNNTVFELPRESLFKFTDTNGNYFNNFLNPSDFQDDIPIIPVFANQDRKKTPWQFVNGGIGGRPTTNPPIERPQYVVGEFGRYVAVTGSGIGGEWEYGNGFWTVEKVGQGYQVGDIVSLERPLGSTSPPYNPPQQMTINTLFNNPKQPSFWDDSNIQDMPFISFIIGQDSKIINNFTLENDNDLDEKNLIPYPMFGEYCSPSRSFYDGEYSMIVNPEKIRLTADEIGAVQPREENGDQYLSATFNWNGDNKITDGSVNSDGSSISTIAYKPYVNIGATDPVFNWDTNSSRFGIQQLHTPINAGNKNSVWYQGNPSTENTTLSPYPKNNEQSLEKVTSSGEYQTALSRYVRFSIQNAQGVHYIQYEPGFYTQNLTAEYLINGTVNYAGGRQNASLTSLISSQCGISISNLYCKKNEEYILLTDNNYEFNSSLWFKMGFNYRQLMPEYGTPSTIFNRSTHSSSIRENIYKQYTNQVKPFTTNSYLSGGINVDSNKTPGGRPQLLLGGIDPFNTVLVLTESDELKALSLPKKLAYGYYTIHCDIIDSSLWYSSSKSSIDNSKLIGFVARNYITGNYEYSFASDYSYTNNRNRTISYIQTTIRTPDGQLASSLDENSSVIYKIVKRRA